METSLFLPEELPKWRAPASLQEMFALFSVYDPAKGLSSILDRLNYDNVIPEQVYQTVLNRMPEPDLGFGSRAYDPRSHFQDALLSKEFQARVPELIANAFEGKKRLLFLHIPKCSGTDLIVNLSRRSVPVRTSLMDPDWSPKEQLFANLMRIALDLQFAPSLLIAGHVKLSWLLRWSFFRPLIDRLFTVLRDPIEIAISQANYIASRMMILPSTSPDVQSWRKDLGLESTAGLDVCSLGLHVLRTRTLVPGNTICRHLGAGDAESALENVRKSDIEVSESARYNRWLRKAWGIESKSRHNSAPQVIRREDLDQDTLAYLVDISADDRALFNHVVEAMGEESSVMGSQIQ